jgi:hypothetical protein
LGLSEGTLDENLPKEETPPPLVWDFDIATANSEEFIAWLRARDLPRIYRGQSLLQLCEADANPPVKEAKQRTMHDFFSAPNLKRRKD